MLQLLALAKQHREVGRVVGHNSLHEEVEASHKWRPKHLATCSGGGEQRVPLQNDKAQKCKFWPGGVGLHGGVLQEARRVTTTEDGPQIAVPELLSLIHR